MSEILDHIHQDHQNMVQLLDLLDDELARIEAGDDHDYVLAANIVDYFTHYPDHYHHPFEDRVFAWIGEQRPNLLGKIADLQDEHESQGALGRELSALLTAVLAGHMVPRDRLINDLTSYIEVQRNHIDKEEGGLLKEVEGVLSGLHLREIPVPDRAALDPLFGDKTHPDFSAAAIALGQRRGSGGADGERKESTI